MHKTAWCYQILDYCTTLSLTVGSVYMREKEITCIWGLCGIQLYISPNHKQYYTKLSFKETFVLLRVEEFVCTRWHAIMFVSQYRCNVQKTENEESISLVVLYTFLYWCILCKISYDCYFPFSYCHLYLQCCCIKSPFHSFCFFSLFFFLSALI